jgi:monoamine oxidase
LIQQLGLEVFAQYSNGRLVYQEASGRVRRDLDFSTMGDALRVDGGIHLLARAMADRLPQGVLRLGARVERLTLDADVVRAELSTGEPVVAERVVLATPPRVAAEQIAIEPPLPESMTHAMRAVPTWMAGHAKAVAVYEEPFWRHQGLSGDAMSRVGPLAEIHDASPRNAGVGALFGFFGEPPAWRRRHADSVEQVICSQLETLFGSAAAMPRKLWIVDWVEDREISVVADEQMPMAHPTYGPLPTLDGAWRGKLHFAGTEVAPREGGFIEGAILAAEAAVKAIRSL